jgi:hypothetical protein
MFETLLRSLRLLHKTSALPSGCSAGDRQNTYPGHKPPQAQSQCLRLRHKTSAWASAGPAGGRRVAACLERWCALPLRGPLRP